MAFERDRQPRGVGMPNPYDLTKITGASHGTPNRALIVDVKNDPQQRHYVKIRMVGWDNMSEMPDEKLPWVPVRLGTGSAGLQTATSTHSLVPGTMVTVEAGGLHGADFHVTGVIPNDRGDDNQSHHPSTTGEKNDKGHTDEQFKDKTFAWGKPLKQIMECTTTEQAKQNRDQCSRKSNRTADPQEESCNKCSIPDYYGQRTTSKDPQGGSIAGGYKFQGSDAQKYIQQTIQNRSAILPNAVSALENLKKVRGNPTAIDSIGAGNYMALLQQIASWFSSGGGSQQQAKKYDCNYLLNTPDDQLDPDQLAQKALCLVGQQAAQGTPTS